MAPTHVLLRTVMALASLGLVMLPFTVAGGLPLFAAGLVVLTAFAVARPESLAVVALLVGSAFHWTTTTPVPDRLPQWLAVLGGAWLALLVHVSASASVTWPAQAAVPRRALLRWAVRTAVVGLAAVPVWAVAAVTRGQSLRGEVSMTYVALAALTLLGGVVFLLARQSPTSSGR